jgi:hypothetical protein
MLSLTHADADDLHAGPPLLPLKKSHMLYMRQQEAYKAVLSSGVDAWVAGGAGASAAATSTPKASTSMAAEADAGMTLHR